MFRQLLLLVGVMLVLVTIPTRAQDARENDKPAKAAAAAMGGPASAINPRFLPRLPILRFMVAA